MERRARRRAGLRPALLHLLLAALAALAGAQEEVNLCEESWWKESLRPECAAGPALPLLPAAAPDASAAFAQAAAGGRDAAARQPLPRLRLHVVAARGPAPVRHPRRGLPARWDARHQGAGL